MSRKLHKYNSDDILVTYDAKRCIHAAECVRGLPIVFDTEKRPWIQPDQATADEIVEVVMRCPTGALQFERQDGGAGEPTPDKNTIQVDPDGPLYLHGDVEIMTADGERLLTDTRVALCRCGASQDKPFCDGSHHKIVFQASGELGENMLGQKEVENGKLTVTPAKNGPLLLQGQVEIVSANGESSCQGSKGALCRCGASENKPFCDGAHNIVGFESE